VNVKNEKDKLTFLRGIAAINARPLDEERLNESIRLYSETGYNSNEIHLVPTRVPLVNVSTANLSEVYKPMKYGWHPVFFTSVVNMFDSVPYGIALLIDIISQATSLTFSNFIGPVNLLPIPSYNRAFYHVKRKSNSLPENTEPPKNEVATKNSQPSQNENYVKWIFGIATPSTTMMNFTFMTYNNHGRLGIVSDTNVVQNPSELIACFMEEWKKYDANV